MGNHLIFDKEKIEQYFARLNVPKSHRVYDITDLSSKDALDYLGLLQRLHLSSVPFENLDLHYSCHHSIVLDILQLFDKIVGSEARGGYCMENNALFHALLLSLGFSIYSCGARVNQSGSFLGW
jgi:arylamine N-acetyltransferase